MISRIRAALGRTRAGGDETNDVQPNARTEEFWSIVRGGPPFDGPPQHEQAPGSATPAR